MKAKLIGSLINVFLLLLSPDLLKLFVDTVLDFIEDYVAGTKSEIDDKVVLPLCDMIRKTFDIPDHDG